MKRQLFTNLLATLLLAMPAIVGFAQDRTCSTMEILEQQLLQDPDQATRMEAIERHTEDFIHEHAADGSGRVVITIPVVFHIVHNGDALGTNENISDALVLAQLNQLNQDFALTNSDANLIPSIFLPVAANTEIQFCLAQRKPDGTATNGINRINGGQASWTSSQINSNLKPTTIWNRNQYLNIWSVVFGGSSSGLLGYAQFPGGNANTDGIVVLYSSVGSLATPNPQGGITPVGVRPRTKSGIGSTSAIFGAIQIAGATSSTIRRSTILQTAVAPPTRTSAPAPDRPSR